MSFVRAEMQIPRGQGNQALGMTPGTRRGGTQDRGYPSADSGNPRYSLRSG